MNQTKQILILGLILFWVVGLSRWTNRESYGASTPSKQTSKSASSAKKPAKPSQITRRGKTSVKGSTPTRSRTSAAPKVSTKSSGYISSFTTKPNLDNTVLYFSPIEVRKRAGEEFVTAITLSNQASRKFDRLFIVLSYDPQYIEPVGIKDNWLRSLASKPPSAKVYYEEGVVIYEVELSRPINPDKRNLFFIKWRTLNPTTFTQIEFSGVGDKFTKIALGENDILGEPTIEGDGVIPASVTITTPSGTEEEIMPSSEEFSGYIYAGSFEIPDFTYGIHLFLMPEKEIVHLNEEFFVHIYLANNERVPADNLSLVIQYNPRILEVIDYDEENWITRGINIFDGLYHENFPFDYQIRNYVNPDKGLIYYRMGSSEPEIFTNSGTVATIKCKARMGNVTTALRFIMPDENTDNATRVTFMNYDVLGSPDDVRDGVTNCVIKISE